MTTLHSPFLSTESGEIRQGDSQEVLLSVDSGTVDLIVTSPPFGLLRQKDYGNAAADAYCDWFRPFAFQFHRILKDSGSLVIDIGGAWNRGVPTRSLYHFKLLIMLCEEYGFHLAQEFYWWNPSRLPTPAEWVNVRRVRVKDAIDPVWWLSKTEFPRASNRRVLQPYSDSMRTLLEKGYRAKRRPSGHQISEHFARNNGAAIPPNLLAIPNTESNSHYLRYCEENHLAPHPARFPAELPEFFIRMLTDPADLVVDPFAGSCVTGEVCERLGRRWLCVEMEVDYLSGARGRFLSAPRGERTARRQPSDPNDGSYRIARPGIAWRERTEGRLPADGGKKRPPKATVQPLPRLPRASAEQAELDLPPAVES